MIDKNKIDLSFVIPTYNEKENIEILIGELFDELKKNNIDGEIIIVDDNSPDGTGNIVDELGKKYENLRIIHRKGKEGLSSAVLKGFSVAKAEILGVMDADLSHPADKVPEMFDLIKKKGIDFVVGSRYVKGGGIRGWGFKRKLMSRVATYLARPFTSVKDPMSGFFMIKKKCLGKREFDSEGFKILLELIMKADYNRMEEVPIVFHNRTKGKSKANSKEILCYLKNLFRYLPYKKKVIQEFLKFAFVGLIGTLVNLGVLYLFTEFFGVYYLFSATVAFVVAATNNFVLNKVWTFRENLKERVFRKYGQFFSVSLVALMVNLLFLYFFTEVVGIYYMISQVLAIGVALIINFLGNKFWTFRK